MEKEKKEKKPRPTAAEKRNAELVRMARVAILDLGGVEKPEVYAEHCFYIQTPLGPLRVIVYADHGFRNKTRESMWFACCFQDDLALAKAYFGKVGFNNRFNPFSGKWNWHGTDDPNELEQFSKAVKKIFADHPDWKKSTTEPTTTQEKNEEQNDQK